MLCSRDAGLSSGNNDRVRDKGQQRYPQVQHTELRRGIRHGRGLDTRGRRDLLAAVALQHRR